MWASRADEPREEGTGDRSSELAADVVLWLLPSELLLVRLSRNCAEALDLSSRGSSNGLGSCYRSAVDIRDKEDSCPCRFHSRASVCSFNPVLRVPRSHI